MIGLILNRHGRTAYNVKNRLQGQEDVPLDNVGKEQADEQARCLAQIKGDCIESPDLQRCRKGAEKHAEYSCLDLVINKGWRERHFGEHQGVLVRELEYDPEYWGMVKLEKISLKGLEKTSKIPMILMKEKEFLYTLLVAL